MRQETLEYMDDYYRLTGWRLETRAKEFIAARIKHPCAVSLSWGKDSVLAAYLCSGFLTDSDWLFSVSPGEYDLPDTKNVRDAFLTRFPNLQYREYRSGDYFEAAAAYGLADLMSGDTTKMKSKKTDIFAIGQKGAAMRVWGIRAEENPATRGKYADFRGAYAFNKRDDLFVLSPIIRWTWQDVWSVILANKLPYCEVYDKYDETIGLERARSGAWAGTRGCRMGRIVMLKMFYPDLYNRFVARFPEVGSMG